MSGLGARLGIDYSHAVTAGRVRLSDGRVLTLTFDGSASLPAGVAVAKDGSLSTGRAALAFGTEYPDLYVRLPGRHLGEDMLRVGDVEVDPVDLAAATLRQIVGEARKASGGAPITEAVIAVPPRWGPRRRLQLRKAAHRAGLTQTKILDGAEAIVREAMAEGHPVPVGATVVVCRLDAVLGEVSVLRRGDDGFEPMGTHDLGELATEVSGETVVEQAVIAAGRALDAAGVEAGQVAAVYCLVPASVLPGLAAALTTRVGIRVTPVPVSDLAAASGSLRSVVPDQPAPAKPSWSRAMYSLLSAAVCGVGVAIMAMQLLGGSFTVGATSLNREYVVTDWAGWGLVVVFATLGGVSLTLLAADLRTARKPDLAVDVGGRDRVLGSGLVVLAALSVGGAVIWSLIGAAQFTVGPMPFLVWTLWSAGPLAGLLAGVGLLVARTPDAVRARDRLRFPLDTLSVAVASVVAVHLSLTGIPFGFSRFWGDMAQWLGGAGIGVAVALLLTPRRPIRFLVMFVLGVTAGLTVNIDTITALGVILIIAITLWWLVRAIQAVRAFLPSLTTDRIGGQPEPRNPPPTVE
jgi:hypothetical protein